MGVAETADNTSASSGDAVSIPVKEFHDVPMAQDSKMKRIQSGTPAGLRITFKNLTYTVKSSFEKGKLLKLLDSVSGFFEPGEMCALMGPSGSGKTTLLDVLAGRKTVGAMEGDLLFAGTKPTSMFLRRYTGYVEQFDTLIGTLTPYEMLLYTAELKRDVSEPLEEKKQAVERVIASLALETCRNTPIGNALTKGISGGQAKRVNIGIALVSNPRVLFLDEPSSGLDSFTSNEMLGYVKGLAKTGITICSTIHSPTAYAFSLFDRLIMLLRGRVIYFGINDANTVQYFRNNVPAIEGVSQETMTNPAEWIVDLTTKGDRQGKTEEFASAYANSPLCKDNMAELENEMCAGCMINPATLEALKVKRATVTPFWWAMWVLLRYRTFRDFKNPDFLGPRIGDKIIFSIVIFSAYWHVGNTSNPAEYINIAAVLFMWCTLPAFGAASYTPALVLERPLFIRERNDGLYRVITYLSAKILGELLLAFPVAAIVSCYVWFALKLSGFWLIYYLAYVCTLMFGIVLAYFVASLSPNMDVANAALPCYVVTLLFFAGFLLVWDNIPGWWIWYAYINPLRYAWGALMVNQFNSCCPGTFLAGKTVLEYYSLDGVSSWVFLAILFSFSVVFFIGAWLGLTFINHSKR